VAATTDAVLLRVLAGGICGSDLPYFRGATPPGAVDGWSPAPGFPMHEVVGEVVAAGDPALARGTKVVGWAAESDAIAEYVLTRASDVAPYDPGLAPATAILLQPLACVIEALDRVPGIDGARVAVLGQGPIGVLFSHVARSRGARQVVAVDRVDRADVARRFGVDEFVHTSSDRWAATVSDARRPDVVIECVGHQPTTLNDAVRAVAMDGVILYYGIPDDLVYPVPLLQLLRKRLTLLTTMTKDRSGAVARACDYLVHHPELRELYVTHRFPADDVERAFTVGAVPTAGRLKVALTMA
jgi:threonine dehydrogenase-like Zn-dependent dehydrogenase